MTTTKELDLNIRPLLSESYTKSSQGVGSQFLHLSGVKSRFGQKVKIVLSKGS